MNRRALGRTGLQVAALGFGCGMVGGLLVRGEYPAMRRAVARAIELGLNYFDTAPLYGDGQSEVNLGAILRELRADVVVGTKVRVAPHDLDRVGPAIVESVEASLRRLGRDSVDLFQLHNPITLERRPKSASLTPDDMPVAFGAFEALHRQGKIRFWGITALGDTEALHQVVNAGGFHTLQTVYNLLNPSAGHQVRADFPYQDYRRLIDRAAANRIGVIAIRVLAGGALSGTTDRHPIAMRGVTPLATGRDYAEDTARARQFDGLIADGTVGSLIEAAIRFAIGKREISTAMVGTSSVEQLEQAVAAANRGPLPAQALERLASAPHPPR
jgi:aryl-alcohol dehydrogenase-like predicted oxidoreductase